MGKNGKSVAELMADISDGNAIDDAIVRGVRQALAVHKRLGQSVVSWRDGKIGIIPPEEIAVGIEESITPRGPCDFIPLTKIP